MSFPRRRESIRIKVLDPRLRGDDGLISVSPVDRRWPGAGEMEIMSKLKEMVPHHEAEIAELRADRELASRYLQEAIRALNNPQERAAGLLALRTVAEAYGGLAAVAAEAGISRESLYRALSPKGNPTLKTLIAVLKTLGLRLSVEPEKPLMA